MLRSSVTSSATSSAQSIARSIAALVALASVTAGCGDNELVCDYDLAAGHCRHPGEPYGHAPAPPEGDTGARLTTSPSQLILPDIPLDGAVTGVVTLHSSGSTPLTISSLTLSLTPPESEVPWSWTLSTPSTSPPAILQPGQSLPVEVTVRRIDSKAEILGEIQVAHLVVDCDAFPYDPTLPNPPTARLEAHAR